MFPEQKRLLDKEGTLIKKIKKVLPIFFTLFIGFSLIFIQVPKAEAHSTLIETTPEKMEVTDTSPKFLELRFNEPIEQDLADITIYDWNAKPVISKQSVGGEKRSKVLHINLPNLKQGTYTVQWSVVSLDGHPVSGSYMFAVGKETKGGAESIKSKDGSSIPLLVATRTIVEILLLIGGGLYWFHLLAKRKKFVEQDILPKKVKLISSFILLLGTILELLIYTLSLPEGLFQTIIDGRWDLLLHFPFIVMVAVQLLLIILLFIPEMVEAWYLVIWFLLVIIPAFGGHVWGMEHPYIAAVPRTIHQLSIALWVGALSYLVIYLIRNKLFSKEKLSTTFRSFFVKNVLTASIMVIISGIIMVILQTGWSTVITEWGNWSTILFVKIFLVVLMLLFALYQTLKWKKIGRFSTPRILRIEWLIALVIIFLGVWLSQSAYPIPSKSYNSVLTSGQEKVQVKIAKLQAGDQKMTLTFPASENHAPDRVQVSMEMPKHGMKSGPFIATLKKDGVYQVELPFTMSGTWDMTIQAEYTEMESKEWKDQVFVNLSRNE
ncbi:hypothetical protein BLX88_08380 [Bacillus obstructivus]|nr:hypothetical protein BLX88_08380 [Bacillus obstructivus]